MKLNHHPSDALLLDYTSGSQSEAWGLAIATHLAFCPNCRQTVSHWEAVGGGMLHSVEPILVDTKLINSVMARIEEPETLPEIVVREDADNLEVPILPQPLRRFLGGDVSSLEWQRLGFGAFQFLIPVEDGNITARLLKIPADRSVPEHSHRGTELTIVLYGAYSDITGTYSRGDFQEADESLEHQPQAASHEDCICLAVTDAPLRFKSLTAKILQPILGI
jgi:putative transcriptional regulator